MINVGFDIDGVILDLITPMKKEFKTKYNIDLNLYLTSFKFNIPNLSNEEISETVEQVILDSYKTIKLYPTVLETLTIISRTSENPIYFITARNPKFREVTEESLKRTLKNINYKVIFTGKDNNEFDKVDHIKRLNIQAFVEDNPETCNQLSPLIDKVFLMNRIYNANEYVNDNVIKIILLKKILKYL